VDWNLPLAPNRSAWCAVGTTEAEFDMANGIGLDSIRQALSAAGDPWEAGFTSFSSLSSEERKAYLGVMPGPGEPSLDQVAAQALQLQAQVKAAALEAVGAPAAFDWRNAGGNNYVTPVKNQANCGSCVAFGAVATVETTYRVQRGNPTMAVDLSEAHLFYCHGRVRGRNCSTGWMPGEALEDFKTKGVVDEACYPYTTTNTDCSGLCSNASDRLTRISGYEAMTGNAARIKEWLSTRGAVSACFIVYDDFFSYRSGVYRHVSGNQAGGHCVSIVGYDDAQACWICKNSWGTGWGDGGFFRIAYGECAIDTWQNHGVQGIEETGWLNNSRVIGLWAINQDRNAYAYIEAVGWRRVAFDNDNIFHNMLSDLVAAKGAARPVNLYQEQGVIKQIYVF
jgi:C1A family cysteine protease